VAASGGLHAPGSASPSCRDEVPDFINDVRDAIGTLKDEQPAIFDPSNTIVVVNPGAYYVGLVKILDRSGLCAGFDGEELQVKRNNDYNEQYKVLSSKNVSGSKYIGTCYPAAFPLATAALPPPPQGCSLPSSRELACGNPPSQFEDLMNAAVQQVIKDRPELFDFGDTAAVTGFPRVKDFDGYYAAIVDRFARQGFCGRFDGEEMVVKRTNEFSEHFKINLSDRYVRYGAGIYRGACYPAAF
jgi:hypothetical protein